MASASGRKAAILEWQLTTPGRHSEGPRFGEEPTSAIDPSRTLGGLLAPEVPVDNVPPVEPRTLHVNVASSLSRALLVAVAAGTVAQAAPGTQVKQRWVGLCVKVASSNKLVREAVVIQSSGEPELDKRMQEDAVGLRVPVHTPLERWTPLRVGPRDTPLSGALAANDEPALPEIDCSRLEAREKPRP